MRDIPRLSARALATVRHRLVSGCWRRPRHCRGGGAPSRQRQSLGARFARGHPNCPVLRPDCQRGPTPERQTRDHSGHLGHGAHRRPPRYGPLRDILCPGLGDPAGRPTWSGRGGHPARESHRATRRLHRKSGSAWLHCHSHGRRRRPRPRGHGVVRLTTAVPGGESLVHLRAGGGATSHGLRWIILRRGGGEGPPGAQQGAGVARGGHRRCRTAERPRTRKTSTGGAGCCPSGEAWPATRDTGWPWRRCSLSPWR